MCLFNAGKTGELISRFTLCHTLFEWRISYRNYCFCESVFSAWDVHQTTEIVQNVACTAIAGESIVTKTDQSQLLMQSPRLY